MRWLFPVLVLLSMAALFLPTGGGTSPLPDKVIHMIIFGGLAGTGFLAGFRIDRLVGGLLAYAVTSEILQGLLPIHRSADWRDAIADACGIAIGLAAGYVVGRITGGSAGSLALASRAGTPEPRR